MSYELYNAFLKKRNQRNVRSETQGLKMKKRLLFSKSIAVSPRRLPVFQISAAKKVSENFDEKYF